ncbi:MAG TPA: YlxR family protein [Acidimicrobiia bacterium]|nr:YlxR family protein [Acidimicrobiia bacterium]
MGCRRVDDARALLRVSFDRDGAPRLGPGPGRGAWLCRPPATLGCLDAALRRGALDRALRAPLPGPGVTALRAKLAGLSG